MNYKKVIFILIIGLMIFGCGKKENVPKFNFSTGYPDLELVENVPEPEFGNSSYYDYYDGSIYIIVKNVTEEDAKNYISTLTEHGWNIDLADNNTETNFSASNEKGQNILVTYQDSKIEITVRGN